MENKLLWSTLHPSWHICKQTLYLRLWETSRWWSRKILRFSRHDRENRIHEISVICCPDKTCIMTLVDTPKWTRKFPQGLTTRWRTTVVQWLLRERESVLFRMTSFMGSSILIGHLWTHVHTVKARWSHGLYITHVCIHGHLYIHVTIIIK